MNTRLKLALFLLFILAIKTVSGCENPCYSAHADQNCQKDEVGQQSYTMHMSVHPHLDAFWIFNFQSYYDPKPSQGDVMSYFRSNRFNSVKEIFNTIVRVLSESKEHRETFGKGSQKSHRSFMNSEMGFFKRWYNEQNAQTKAKVQQLLKTKYWEIIGGGFVEHDQGCAYYDDIIENYQAGFHFLRTEFNYTPKAAISADSFGHSQTTLAILAHLGIEGYFVERSDEHILLQNKTEFIWKAKSANGQYYGALPTHIRWAIHGFQDQFIGSGIDNNLCSSKQAYINNMRRENEFLKRILHSPHIMRYFGHDFQQFDEYSYSVIEAIMTKFSSEKCNKVVAVYGNPTQYFLTLMGEVFGQKKKPIAIRQEDIFPIWDYDSGLYWTGYYTTDPFHKKNYRDVGRFLYGVRKFIVPSYTRDNSKQNLKIEYDNLQKLAQQVTYLQHHDGISGTSKYTVMDELENQNEQMIETIKQSTLKRLFEEEFDSVEGSVNEYCIFGTDCKITSDTHPQINLKIFNSAGYKRSNEPFIIQLPYDTYYVPNCPHEINCLCQEIPCECSLYLYPENYGAYLTVKLTKQHEHDEVSKFIQLKQQTEDKMFSFNSTHFKIELNGAHYAIGYKKVIAESTNRYYAHLSRYGDQYERSFNIRSGKYALGNDPNKISDLTEINKVLKLESKRNIIILVKWNREGMKTLITINKAQNNEWKVETHSASEAYHLEDLYLEVATDINNEKKFFTDSNGWLVMKRELFHHEDYKAHFDPNKFDDIDGNSYPMTAFCYIEDAKDKVSINTDRPQGVIAYRPGALWVNFDRLSSDDGKWVYENTFRSDYQKFTHVITVQNKDYNERKVQALYDMPIIMQISYSQASEEPAKDNDALLKQWSEFSGLNNLKTLIKPINDSTVVVRIHNLNDKQSKQVKLFAGQISPLLTAFYGSLATITNVQERSLGNNMNYQEFIDNKWNWESVIDLKNQNSIFNKEFGETITLRPLQIRTFLFHGLKFVEKCQSPSKVIQQTGKTVKYNLNTSKEAPKREQPLWEKDVISYMLHENHCNVKSPVGIDKKYPSEDVSQDYHELKNTQSNDYYFVTHMSAANRKELDKKRDEKTKPVDNQPKPPVDDKTKPQVDVKPKPPVESKPKPPVAPGKNEPTKQQAHNQGVPKEDTHKSQQRRSKLKFVQIHKKITELRPLTKQEKEIYFGIRLNQIKDMLYEEMATVAPKQ